MPLPANVVKLQRHLALGEAHVESPDCDDAAEHVECGGRLFSQRTSPATPYAPPSSPERRPRVGVDLLHGWGVVAAGVTDAVGAAAMFLRTNTD